MATDIERDELFPTLSDGIGAPVVADGPEARLERLRRCGAILAASFIVVAIATVCARTVLDVDTVYWLLLAASLAFLFASLGLWRDLLREDEKKAQRIRDRDQRYRQTLALLPEGVVILGEGWRVEWINERAMVHLDIKPEGVGRSFFESVKDGAFRRWLVERNFSAPFALTTPEGRELEVAVVAPDLRHTLIVTHDGTERRRVDDMRRDFVANVSHELRTPLTVITGFLELDDSQKVPAELLTRHRKLMHEQASRMKSLLDDLLLLASLENRDENADADAAVIAMPRLVEDVTREGRALSNGRHKIEVTTEDVSLIGVADEIRSAAMNLVSNAVRYTPEGGKIHVSWKRVGTSAEFSVADTGIGIEAKHIPRLTERFYRVDKGRSRDTGGTGLGLAIVKHVLRRNGGELMVQSTPGKGSIFTLRFPESRIFAEK